MRDKRDFYVIAYDIRDDGRRNKLAAALENFIPRVQYSVFEGRLTETLLNRLRDLIGEIVKTEKLDAVRIYHLCPHCLARTEAVGGNPVPEDETFVIV